MLTFICICHANRLLLQSSIVQMRVNISSLATCGLYLKYLKHPVQLSVVVQSDHFLNLTKMCDTCQNASLITRRWLLLAIFCCSFTARCCFIYFRSDAAIKTWRRPASLHRIPRRAYTVAGDVTVCARVRHHEANWTDHVGLEAVKYWTTLTWAPTESEHMLSELWKWEKWHVWQNTSYCIRIMSDDSTLHFFQCHYIFVFV